MEDILFEWLDLHEPADPGDTVTLGRHEAELILGAYKRAGTEQARRGALDHLDKLLPFVLSGQLTKGDAAYFLEWGIRFTRQALDQSEHYQVIVERLFRRYSMDPKYLLRISPQGWKIVMEACCKSKPSERDGALKTCIFTLAQARKAGCREVWIYEIYLSCICHNTVDTGFLSKLAEAGFEGCAEDGCLTGHLLNRFRQVIRQDKWHALYTSHLSPNGEMPKEWSENVPQATINEGSRRHQQKTRQ
jgi:hypothetical protein